MVSPEEFERRGSIFNRKSRIENVYEIEKIVLNVNTIRPFALNFILTN